MALVLPPKSARMDGKRETIIQDLAANYFRKIPFCRRLDKQMK